MSLIIEDIFAVSGIGFLFKTIVHLYLNFKLIDKYNPINRNGAIGTDPALFLPIHFKKIHGNNWVIKISNIFYYLFILSLIVFLLSRFTS